MEKLILAWSKCEVKIGDTGADDAAAVTRTSVGTIMEKSSTLTGEDGEVLEMYASGHELIAREEQDGTLKFTTTVVEPSADLYKALGFADVDSEKENGIINVKKHTVDKELTLEVVPKYVGAYGILAPKCSLSSQPSYDEEKGNLLVLTFTILKSQTLGYWYQKVKKKA